jgi:hypothetical protein
MCILSVTLAHAEAQAPNPKWLTYEHGIGLENDNATPFITLSRGGVTIELRPATEHAPCGVGTWEQLMNTLATDMNRTVRMRSAPCGNGVVVFVDTDENRRGDDPATDGSGFTGTVSWK